MKGPDREPRAMAFVRLLRPQQWYKNGIVLAPLVFSENLGEVGAARNAAAGFAVFCLLSSGTYALNDAWDAKADQLHPTKRRRPVAAGLVSATAAYAFGLWLLLLALAGGYLLDPRFALIGLAYIALQVFYITVLRKHFLLDLASITGGFFLRAVAGVVLVAVPMSPWLLLCTLFLALFLGLGKRRHELLLLGPEAAAHRPALKHYTREFLAQATQITATALLVSYSLYTFYHTQLAMMATIPFVLYGLFRYLYLVDSKGAGGEPEAVFRDVPSLVNMALWGLTVVAVLYGAAEAFADRLWGITG